MKRVSVVIPTYYPDGKLKIILNRLIRQSVPVCEICIINTEKGGFPDTLEEEFRKKCEKRKIGFQVIHIEKREFDHAETRNRAAFACSGERILFLTQDAIPVDRSLVEELLEKSELPFVAAAYARQLPYKHADLLEKESRSFNYGEKDLIKTKECIPKLGIKTFFCSNVCCMYDAVLFRERGGFTSPAIFNEDMVYAGGAILDGLSIAYASKAMVYHSHNYRGLTQFHRNFDLAVSQCEHPEIFSVCSSEQEGIKMVKTVAVKMLKQRKPWLLFSLVWVSGWKYLGYFLGKRYRSLPKRMIRIFTWNPEYWKKRQ